MSTEAQKKANRKYREKHKPVQFAIQYKTDKIEGLRLKAYLSKTGKSANAYIKELIQDDLDMMNIPYPDNADDNDNTDNIDNIDNIDGNDSL